MWDEIPKVSEFATAKPSEPKPTIQPTQTEVDRRNYYSQISLQLETRHRTRVNELHSRTRDPAYRDGFFRCL